MMKGTITAIPVQPATRQRNHRMAPANPMEVIDIIKLRDGKFIEHWGILDMQSVMAQITG